MSSSQSEKYVAALIQSKNFLESKGVKNPDVAIVLGSGLGGFGDEISNKTIIPYSEIPNFPISTVVGHSGNLIYGTLGQKRIIAMQGRVHQYEGHSGPTVAFAARVLCLLGAKLLIVTNASGGIAKSLRPGSLMVLNNVLGFFSDNPSTGLHHEVLGSHFYDVSHPFDAEVIKIAKEEYAKLGIEYAEGVYALCRGPAYETAAEINALRIMGADAVGMSTVPEVLAARQMKVRVFGISLITNLAAGVSPTPLNHEEVMREGKDAAKVFQTLMKNIIARV